VEDFSTSTLFASYWLFLTTKWTIQSKIVQNKTGMKNEATTKTFGDDSFGKCSSRSSEIQQEESWPPASTGIYLIDEKISEAKTFEIDEKISDAKDVREQ
jgi:hypothetical protein